MPEKTSEEVQVVDLREAKVFSLVLQAMARQDAITYNGESGGAETEAVAKETTLKIAKLYN